MSELILKSLKYIKYETYENLGIYIGLYRNSHLLFIDAYHSAVNPIYWFDKNLTPMFPTSVLVQIPTIGELKFIIGDYNIEDDKLDFKIWTHFHIDNLYYSPNRSKKVNLIFVNRIY